jgi:ATPase family associated with various cellular activities (AAA)
MSGPENLLALKRAEADALAKEARDLARKRPGAARITAMWAGISAHDAGMAAEDNPFAALFESLEGQEDRCVLFMDEFDAVATKRTEDNQAAAREMNATVNALLQRIEAFGGTTIAATNRAEVIDPAMWRRFGLHLDIALPGDDERFAILTRYLEPYRLPEAAMDVLCEATSGAPPALLRQLMEGIKRDLILSPRLNRATDAKAVFARLLVSVKPHPDYDKPALWDDRDTRQRVMEISWPPAMNKKEAA